MSGLEEQISRLLGDPAEMEKLTKLASSLMEGGAFPMPGSAEPPEPPPKPPAAGNGGPDMRMLASMGRLLGQANQTPGRGSAVMEALKPYMAEKRQAKMDRAIRIARMAKLAKLAMDEFGGDGDGGL